MIAQLTGKLVGIGEGQVVLDVGGVGFALYVPKSVAVRAGDPAVFYTHLHVRESELTLYGFLEEEQKTLFELLLGVSGVGPKAALSLLSILSPDTLRSAVLNKQPEVLARAPGVGRKTAEAIVLHLKDRLARSGVAAAPLADDDADVIAALTALGFSIVEAQRALQQIPRTPPLSLDEKIRHALAMLGK